MSGVTHVMHVPTFDGHASSFANHERKSTLQNQIPTRSPRKSAANVLLHMTDVARKVCMSVGEDVAGKVDGVAQILHISRERFAPGALNSTFQAIVKFMYFKRTDQTTDTRLMEFVMLRQKAEARILMGRGFHDEFVSFWAHAKCCLGRK